MTTVLNDTALQRMGVSAASAARLLGMGEVRSKDADSPSQARDSSPLVFYTAGAIKRYVDLAREMGYVRD